MCVKWLIYQNCAKIQAPACSVSGKGQKWRLNSFKGILSKCAHKVQSVTPITYPDQKYVIFTISRNISRINKLVYKVAWVAVHDWNHQVDQMWPFCLWFSVCTDQVRAPQAEPWRFQSRTTSGPTQVGSLETSAPLKSISVFSLQPEW